MYCYSHNIFYIITNIEMANTQSTNDFTVLSKEIEWDSLVVTYKVWDKEWKKTYPITKDVEKVKTYFTYSDKQFVFSDIRDFVAAWKMVDLKALKDELTESGDSFVEEEL